MVRDAHLASKAPNGAHRAGDRFVAVKQPTAVVLGTRALAVVAGGAKRCADFVGVVGGAVGVAGAGVGLEGVAAGAAVVGAHGVGRGQTNLPVGDDAGARAGVGVDGPGGYEALHIAAVLDAAPTSGLAAAVVTHAQVRIHHHVALGVAGGVVGGIGGVGQGCCEAVVGADVHAAAQGSLALVGSAGSPAGTGRGVSVEAADTEAVAGNGAESTGVSERRKGVGCDALPL